MMNESEAMTPQEQAQKPNEIDVLKMAMDSINHHAKELWKCRARIQQLEQAQKQQEPVAWYDSEEYGSIRWAGEWSLDEGTPLYTSPPQRPAAEGENTRKEWVGLTDEEFQMIYDMGRTPAGMMEMVEAKLKERNT